MEFGMQLPPDGAAFGHTGTRDAWTAARRRVRWRFTLWSVLCLAGFAVCCVLAAGQGSSSRSDGGIAGLIGAASLLSYVFVLYACLGALRRLRKARDVLQENPWQPVASVRKATGITAATGVPVQFAFIPGAPGGDWTRPVVARNPLRWNRWDGAMEHGAWLAGGRGPMTVLALPGGQGLMTIDMRAGTAGSGRLKSSGAYADVSAAGQSGVSVKKRG